MKRTESYWAILSIATMCGVAALAVLPHAATAQPDVAALVNEMPDADPDGKYTGPAPEEAQRVYEALLKGGQGSLLELIGMLVEPGQGEDYKARYVLHGLAIHVGRPGADAERRMLGDALISTLKGRTPTEVKRFVVQELQFLGEQRAVGALGGLLSDEALCMDAVLALVALGEQAAPPLAKALPKARGRNRLAIIQGLGELRHARSTPALIRILNQGGGEARVAAAAALGKIGDPRAVQPLVRALEASEGYERVQIAEACFVLANNLGQAGAEEAALRAYRGIWRALGDEAAPQTRYAVAEGLALRLSSEATANLVRRLKAEGAAMRAAIVHVLGRRGDATAFPAVASAMEDDDAGVRLMAMSSLGPLGREQSIPLLIAALPGDDPQVSRVLWTALLTAPGDQVNRALADGLSRVADGPDASDSRMIILDVLAERHASEGAEPALRLASDRDVAVRVKALRTLAVVADGTYAPRLVGLLPKATDAEELKALEDALVATCLRIPNEEQRVAPLLPAVTAGEVGPQCLVLRAAGRIGAAASVEVLVTALEDGNAEVRDTAMRALSEFPNDRPAAQLLEIAKTTDNADHHGLALRGYVRMAEQKRDNQAKLAMLGEAMGAARTVEEKRSVLDSISKLNNAEALMALVSYLPNPELANAAGRLAVRTARGMKGRDKDKIRQAMEAVLEHAKAEQVRKDAQDILAGL